MESLSHPNRFEHEAVSFIDNSTGDTRAESIMDRALRVASTTPAVYSAVTVMERLSAYSSIFGYSASCSS